MAFSLSIIIPCYNIADNIPKTLDSLSRLRNAENCEFIFVNDGSTDDTLSYIQNFAKNDLRAIVINQSNQGVSAARNAALKIATKEYLLCLDGDDYLAPNTIQIIQQNIQKADALLTPCIVKTIKAEQINTLGIPNGVYSIDQVYKKCRVFPTAPMIVYRNSIVQRKHLTFNTTIKSGEVYDFTVSFFEYAHTIAINNIGFYYYVMRGSSATHRPNYEADLSVLKIANHFDKISHYWRHSTSFLLTELKMITSFTYNKYVRNGLTNEDTLNTLQVVFSNQHFQKLLSSIITRSVGFKYKLWVIYLKYMPLKIGYLICTHVYQANKYIKDLLFSKKTSNFAN